MRKREGVRYGGGVSDDVVQRQLPPAKQTRENGGLRTEVPELGTGVNDGIQLGL